MMRRATCLALILAWLPAACPAAAVDDGLDSLLAAQRRRAGAMAAELFRPLEPDAGLAQAERADYRFLLANLPLSDLAAMRAEDLRETVRQAQQARRQFPWGVAVPDDLWRHYVLPPRVSQEPFSRWRGRFREELAPRLAGLDMAAAALEVNHWCHEQATYRPTDGRDQDPLTTIRAGFGRCEEEMILAIAALRSVGIPARQCYTPYWAHTNDNHAWVEVWTDGLWSYLGACEPAPGLGQAWFTDAARCAMLVNSQAFGAVPQALGPVLKAEGRSTLVNSTAVYGPVRLLTLRVEDERGRPLRHGRVVFHLFNYGGWMPALVQTTDGTGELQLACGRGSWLVSAGAGDRAGVLHVPGGEKRATLVLRPGAAWDPPRRVDYAPPPRAGEPAPVALPFAEGLARGVVDTAAVRRADQVFQRRLAREDSLREARVWSARERESDPSATAAAPDSLVLVPWLATLARQGVDAGEVMALLRRARGNWSTLFGFLSGPPAAPGGHAEVAARRLRLLGTATDKDLAEAPLAALQDHERVLWNSPVGWGDGRPPAAVAEALPGDSLGRARQDEHVLALRVGGEPVLPWRGALAGFLAIHPELSGPRGDKSLRRWLRRELRVDEDKDRLGAPLTPAQVLLLGGGTRRDIARLYLGFCRVQGVPARANALTGALERWEDGDWRAVSLFKEKGRAVRPATGRLRITAADSLSAAAPVFVDWCLARWEEDRLEPVDLDWQQPLSALVMPLVLPAGRYALSAGRRREDGSAAVRMEWVDVARGREARLVLRLD